jgi:hypothetical protein
MKRSVDMLMDEHPLISRAATISLASLIIAIVVATVAGLVVGAAGDGWVSTTMGVLLGITLVLSLVAMVGATFFVVRQRAALVDGTLFLAVTWLIPYLGISLFLGGAHLRRTMIGRRRSEAH